MPNIKKIDHIGIVVPDIEQAISQYESLLFLEPCHREYFEETKVDLVFFDIGEVYVELLAPAEPVGEMFGTNKPRSSFTPHAATHILPSMRPCVLPVGVLWKPAK